MCGCCFCCWAGAYPVLGDGACADISRASIITTVQKIQYSVFTHVAST